jgi:hypothetical protein
LSKAASISVKFWPEGPIVHSNFSIPGRPLPRVTRVEPQVLIAGIADQTIDLIGENFEQSQPALHRANLTSGLVLPVTPLSDNRLRVHSFPPMPFPKNVWYKSGIDFEPSTDMLGVPRDLIVISQPIVRAISPKTLYISDDFSVTIYVQVQEDLLSFVNFTCFIQTNTSAVIAKI